PPGALHPEGGPTMPRMFWLAILLAAMNPPHDAGAAGAGKTDAVGKVEKTDAEWKKALTPEQYRVLRHAGTEPAFTGAYWNNHAQGMYRCAGCGLELFDSATKFESGTGWPSFWIPTAKNHVTDHVDKTFGMVRDEVT